MYLEMYDVIIVSMNDGEVIILCVEWNEENKVIVVMFNKVKLNDSYYLFRVLDFCLLNKSGLDVML